MYKRLRLLAISFLLTLTDVCLAIPQGKDYSLREGSGGGGGFLLLLLIIGFLYVVFSKKDNK